MAAVAPRAAFRAATPVATGYRWFTPSRPSLAHKVVYGINCTIMSLLGRSSHFMVWGGSWAIRRDTFDAIGLRAAWKGTLSDDLVASRVLRRAKQQVGFQPACVVASPLDFSLSETLSFIRRQYLIARHYARFWWLVAVLSSTLRNVVLLGTLVALGRGLLHGTPSPWIPAALGAVLYGLGAYRGWLMQDLARTYFPDRVASLRAFRRFAVWAAPVLAFVEWLVLLSTLMGRCVVWRGVCHRFLPCGRSVLVARDPSQSPETDKGMAPSLVRNRKRAADRVAVAPHWSFLAGFQSLISTVRL